jgi:putative ABC transport system permease protein
MVIANTMVISMMVLERIYAEVKNNQGRIEAALALGASPYQTVKQLLVDSYRAGLLPTANRLAILGIVNIPGLMSGMVIGGVNPVEAAVYQVIIFLMILAGAFIASLIAAGLLIGVFFTKEEQLNRAVFRQSGDKKQAG